MGALFRCVLGQAKQSVTSAPGTVPTRVRVFVSYPPLSLFLFRAPPTRAGADFFVVLERPGFRVARRRKQVTKIGKPHKLTKTDAMKWFQSKFEGIILNKAYD